jgi:hypothetical protein
MIKFIAVTALYIWENLLFLHHSLIKRKDGTYKADSKKVHRRQGPT